MARRQPVTDLATVHSFTLSGRITIDVIAVRHFLRHELKMRRVRPLAVRKLHLFSARRGRDREAASGYHREWGIECLFNQDPRKTSRRWEKRE